MLKVKYVLLVIEGDFLKYIVGEKAGFCFGVKNAVESARKKLENEKDMCCLGEIVHNAEVVKDLEDKGMKFIENLDENTNKEMTIIRAHGVSKSVYEDAENKGIKLFDLTCPYVLRIHKIVSNYVDNDYYIFLVGAKKHPETIGTAGFCGEHYTILEDENDIPSAVENFKNSGLKKIFVVVQTTYNLEKFNSYAEQINNIFNGSDVEVTVENTICLATQERQEETNKISKEVDYMIIIGGKNSSNTKKLYEIAKKNCEDTICIETYKEIDVSQLKGKSYVGIMAGASTPQSSIDEVIELVKNT